MNAQRIVIVDPDVLSRMAAHRSLQRAGFRVGHASDGAEALEVIELVRPSLILLNLALPIVESLTVLTDVRYLLGRQVRIVITGAHTALLRALQSTRLSIDGFLETPIVPGDLPLYVATALDRAPDGL